METKFKVGDKVRIKSLDWYNSNKDEDGCILFFIKEMARHCGEVFEINSILDNGDIILKGTGWLWRDWMFEEELSTKEQQVLKQLERVQAELDKLRALCNN